VHLLDLNGRIVLKDGTTLKIVAEKGVYDRGTESLDLYDNVTLTDSLDVKVRTNHATINLKTGLTVGQELVHGKASFGTVAGQGFRIADRGDAILVEGPATLVIDPAAKQRAP
jgi:lipopolysaccharide export system protein LptC